MGYDMRLVAPDTTHANELDQARIDFEVAVAERDAFERGTPEQEEVQKRVTEAYERMNRFDTSYFRLNIWGMSTMRESMHTLDMVAYEYDMAPWPESEHFGVTEEESDAAQEAGYQDDPETALAALSQGARDWLAACEAHLSWSPPDEPGLPLHKFGSNDGWLVTPRDCEGALRAFEKAKVEKPDTVEKVRTEWVQEGGSNYFDAWLGYLALAMKHEGFRVF